MALRQGYAVVFVVLACVGSESAEAAYVFTSIDVPGSTNTRVTGVNNAGQAAGWYTDRSGQHGFLWSAGSFTFMDMPGAVGSTALRDINNVGQIVGNATVAGHSGSFLYSAGAYTLLDVSGATQTIATSLNDQGAVTGYDIAANGTVQGFVYAAGAYTAIVNNLPGGDPATTEAFGIDNAGQVVGLYGASGVNRGFLDDAGSFTSIGVPGTGLTEANGINNLGVIVGFSTPSADGSGGYNGFVDNAGTFATLNAPAALRGTTAFGTLPYDANDAGQVVGEFRNLSGNHGFITNAQNPLPVSSVPEPEAAGLFALGLAALVAGRVTRRRR